MVFVHLRPDWWLPEREATEEDRYLSRREILSRWGMGAGALSLLGLTGCHQVLEGQEGQGAGKKGMPASRPASRSKGSPRAPLAAMKVPRNQAYKDAGRQLTPEEKTFRYNNFYEFSLEKDQVWKLVDRFETEPWSVEIAGLVEEPRAWTLEELEKLVPAEERIYRFRCVEAWAMTVPWIGLPLGKLIDKLGVRSKAKYVAFKTFLRPQQAPNQTKESGYPWPYYEAMTIEETRNELSMLALGIYGKRLPKQMGAPIRLIAPWKYGLKNIKAIVRIEFTEKRPATFWNAIAPDEYSWLSNVEPEVPHPRWSQATERLIGSGRRVKTLPHNGYAEQVAKLYR